MSDLRYRYRNDPQFRTLVDMMVSMMARAQFTPTEMREASMLAAMIHSETHIEPMFLPYDKRRL